MAATDFKDLADGLQSLALALGALIGGCWALYTFRNHRHRAKSASGIVGH